MTRILSLSNFPAELKTRDLVSAFAEWEGEKGGFKVKWGESPSSPSSCWLALNGS